MRTPAISLLIASLSAACGLACAPERVSSGDPGNKLGHDAGRPAAPDAGPVVPDSAPPMQPMAPDASEPTPPEASAPGAACDCDADCPGTEQNAAVCVFGVCMHAASSACSEPGSAAECPTGSRCWGLGDREISICWPDCAATSCAGACDDDGSCIPSEATSCDPDCGSLCGPAPCSPEAPTGYCGDAEACVAGTCVETCSELRLDGYCPPDSACDAGVCITSSGCPHHLCMADDCDELIQMPGSTDPASPEAQVAGYYIATQPRYAFLRRDLTMLVQYAACEVAVRFPGTLPIGLSDLSQEDGEVPGTDVGRKRHPPGTHRGNDMDLAYYQTDGSNNPQIICGDGSDRNGNGTAGIHNDGYFCTSEENIVDWPRQAYWFVMLAQTSKVRVFGVDETLADDFEEHVNALVEAGEVDAEAAARALWLGYGNDGGWAYHHHHTHMSYN